MPPAESAAVVAVPTATDPAAPTGDRCAAHPARPAVDLCPVCARPRCVGDAVTTPGGCLLCDGSAPTTTRRRRPVDLCAAAGAAALCHVVAVAAAYVGQQYVEVKWFSLLVPAGVGIVCAIAAERGAGRARGTSLRVLAAVYAVLSTALAFKLEGSVDLFGPLGTVGPPYLAAASGAWFWTQPPKQRKKPAAAR
ncbi:MAG TPA: hypothetical protein VNA14_10715 [Mycobacteriales bacterium]|nr:hypothetical protein [Mycobacteriales bacterium]